MYLSFLSQKSQQMNPLQVPQQGPYEEGKSAYRAFAYPSRKPHISGSPVKEPSPKVPFMESLTDRCPTTRTHCYSSVKVPGI